MQYVKLNDDLYLVSQEIVKKNAKEVLVPKKLNHIFIYDRSGSMYGVLDTLIKDLKVRLRTVPVGDTVTIGWFSSPGQFRFPLKGMKISNDKDFKELDKVLDANSTTLGSTCFSEILADTEDVVKDLAPLGNKFALAFLTDGYPTVYPEHRETAAIRKAIAEVSGKITSSLMVGYGNYYNKELMADMAERFGGALIHSSKLEDFPTAYQQFMEKSRDSEPKVFVELQAKPAANGAVFSLAGGNVNLYQVEDGMVGFSPTKAETDYVFVITDKAPKGGEKVDLTDDANETFIKATYAAAYVLTQRTKTDLALDALSQLGDKAIIDRVNNAFTNTEYGAAEQNMLEAIGSKQKRFTAGRKKNYLPKSDAFCVIDALELLQSDEVAEFWPNHDDFDYKRIGLKAEYDPKYPKFEGDKEARVKLLDLVWNDTMLNLSVRCRIEGFIELPETRKAKNIKLEKNFDTFVWRNYTIVKDGFLNVNKLPVSMSKDTYQRFLEEGVIDPEHNRHYAGRPYTLHLDRLPVINRKIAEGKTSAKALAALKVEELQLMGELKGLNCVRDEIEPKSERSLGMSLTPEQEEFVKELGVTRSGFAPPSTKAAPTDFYMAKEFELKVKGFSSLPSVKDVREKVAAKKTLTASAEVVYEGLKGAAKFKTKADLKTLDTIITARKTSLKQVRSEIQKTKFAVLLAKKWFDEIPSRTDTTIIVDGKEVTFNVREVRIDI